MRSRSRRRQVRWRWERGWDRGGSGLGGNWIIYGNINTYRAFTEDWAAPISSMDFLQEEMEG